MQGVNYGDNVRCKFRAFAIQVPAALTFADETQANKTLKHIAQDAHERIKTAWEHSGTCSWLLQETDLQSWMKMNEEYSFLWLYGNRKFLESRNSQRYTDNYTGGCGKSTLM